MKTYNFRKIISLQPVTSLENKLSHRSFLRILLIFKEHLF